MDSGIQSEPIHRSQLGGRPLDIQLTGKHLAFVFMSAAVVSVVIFLGGVMVGRTERRPVQASLAASSAPPKTTTQAGIPVPPAPEAEVTAPAPPPAVDARSNHLEGTSPASEHLEPDAPKTGMPAHRRRGTGHRRTRSHAAAHRGRSGGNAQ